MQQLMSGDTKYFDYGTPERVILNVRVDRHHDGVSFTVNSGRTELDRTFTNERLAEARTYLAHIRDAANAGQPVWMIESSVSVLSATERVFDDAEADLIASINTDLDAATATRRVESDRLNTDVQNIVADGQGWNALRQANRRDFTATRVHTKPLTPAELHLIRNHRDGVVTTRPGQSWLMLRAIHRRIGGVPTFKPGTRIIASLRLNARQLAAAEGQVAA